jgi:hypothetical protein
LDLIQKLTKFNSIICFCLFFIPSVGNGMVHSKEDRSQIGVLEENVIEVLTDNHRFFKEIETHVLDKWTEYLAKKKPWYHFFKAYSVNRSRSQLKGKLKVQRQLKIDLTMKRIEKLNTSLADGNGQLELKIPMLKAALKDELSSVEVETRALNSFKRQRSSVSPYLIFKFLRVLDHESPEFRDFIQSFLLTEGIRYQKSKLRKINYLLSSLNQLESNHKQALMDQQLNMTPKQQPRTQYAGNIDEVPSATQECTDRKKPLGETQKQIEDLNRVWEEYASQPVEEFDLESEQDCELEDNTKCDSCFGEKKDSPSARRLYKDFAQISKEDFQGAFRHRNIFSDIFEGSKNIRWKDFLTAWKSIDNAEHKNHKGISIFYYRNHVLFRFDPSHKKTKTGKADTKIRNIDTLKNYLERHGIEDLLD